MHPLPFDAARRRLLHGIAAVSSVTLFDGAAAAKASFRGPSRPAYERFALGAFEVTTILDAAAKIDGPWPIVGENRPASDVARLMQ